MMSVLTKWLLQLIKECYSLKWKETISILVMFKVYLNKVLNSQVIKSVVTTGGTCCTKAHTAAILITVRTKF